MSLPNSSAQYSTMAALHIIVSCMSYSIYHVCVLYCALCIDVSCMHAVVYSCCCMLPWCNCVTGCMYLSMCNHEYEHNTYRDYIDRYMQPVTQLHHGNNYMQQQLYTTACMHDTSIYNAQYRTHIYMVYTIGHARYIHIQWIIQYTTLSTVMKFCNSM